MKKRIAILPIVALLCIVSCGVKKNAGIAEKQDLLQIQGHVISQDMYADKPILGLLWQNDSLQITVNQGRQLQGYRASADTMYLYEGASDSITNHTRQYSIYQPTQELLIIKYNDSLVYPIMPAEDRCEYPLDIKSMSAKNIIDFKRKEEENKKKPRTQPILSPNYEVYPLELRAGTYLYNYHQCGNCEIDSTKRLVLLVDGSWLQYQNGTLMNCGIMRKTKIPVYELFNYKKEIVYFLDTTAFNGHIIGFKEDWRRWQENIPYAPNEYLFTGKHSVISCNLFPCQQDSTMLLFFEYGEDYILEGTKCGWKRISNNF